MNHDDGPWVIALRSVELGITVHRPLTPNIFDLDTPDAYRPLKYEAGSQVDVIVDIENLRYMPLDELKCGRFGSWGLWSSPMMSDDGVHLVLRNAECEFLVAASLFDLEAWYRDQIRPFVEYVNALRT